MVDDKKLQILISECRRKDSRYLKIMEELFEHVCNHINQDDDTLSIEISTIIERNLRGKIS